MGQNVHLCDITPAYSIYQDNCVRILREPARDITHSYRNAAYGTAYGATYGYVRYGAL
jgi:hypothetical protein